MSSQLLVLAAVLAPAGTPAPPEVDGARIMAHVVALADEIGARPQGSAAAARAAEYVTAELEACGAQVAAHRGDAGEGGVADVFLVVDFAQTFAPTEPAIVLVAHYDSARHSPGATDDAGGVAVLIELACRLIDAPPRRPVTIAFVSGGHGERAGARALAAALRPAPGLVVAVDRIGVAGKPNLVDINDQIGYEWLSWLARVADSSIGDLVVPSVHRFEAIRRPRRVRSDHAPFTAAGVPAFQLCTRTVGAVAVAPGGPGDVSGDFAAASAVDAAKFLLALVQTAEPLPASGGNPGAWVNGSNNLVVSTVVGYLVAGAFALLAIAGLVSLWRRRSGAPGSLTSVAKVVLAHTAIFVLVGGVRAVVFESLAHPAPWLHDPRYYNNLSLLLAVSLAALLMAIKPPVIEAWGSFLATAIAIALLIGVTLALTDGIELGIDAMWSAALLGAMAWISSRSSFGILWGLAALPFFFGVLSPNVAREAIVFGWLEPTAPFLAAAWLASLPLVLAALYARDLLPVHYLTRRRFVGLAGGVGVVAAILAMALREPRCSGAQFDELGLACETVSTLWGPGKDGAAQSPAIDSRPSAPSRSP